MSTHLSTPLNTQHRPFEPGRPVEADCSGVNNTVIALHCSGGNAKQWRALGQSLESRHKLITPEHYGVAIDRVWCQSSRFTLADEAEQSLRIIDQCTNPIHLVGHSYGGSLALHIALARPQRIASVSLYEPCAFHLLHKLGAVAASALAEIKDVANSVERHIQAGNNHAAMAGFVDYWNGKGAWASMKPEHKNCLAVWAPNANQAFDALFNENTDISAYRNLHVPVHLLQGDCSPQSVKVLSNALMGLLPDVKIDRLSGLGHMGPITHADYIAELISTHIKSQSRGHYRPVDASTDIHVPIDCAA